VGGIGPGSRAVTGFGFHSVEPSGSATRELISKLCLKGNIL
jgi:hypothetical protein